MNAVLWWLGQNTIVVAILIPIVLVACRLFRHRPAVQHVLWLVVLLKFVTPPLVSWPWTVEHIRTAFRTPVLPTEPPLVDEPRVGTLPPGLVAEPVDFPVGLEPTLPDVQVPTQAPSAEAEFWEQTAIVLQGLALGVWLVGALVCAIWQGRRIVRHAALVRRGMEAPEPLLEEIRATAARLGLRPLRAVLGRGVLSPFVWCLGRLRLVWPEALSDPEEILRSRGVLAHELAHVRRGDHWVTWLELVAGLLWWWCPLFWFVRRRLRESAEMACDAMAIGTCPESRREYAELLLEHSAGLRSGAPASVLAVSAGSPSSFERRLSMVLSDRVSGKMSGWGIVVAVCLALMALPGWSLGQQQEPTKVTSPADDPVLRDLIDKGKFPEARERLASLMKKQAADKAVAEGAFLEKWRELLIKDLPKQCSATLPRNTALSWKQCMTCHGSGKQQGNLLTVTDFGERGNSCGNQRAKQRLTGYAASCCDSIAG